MTVSTPQITAQLDAVLAREATAQVVAIRSPTRQDWPASVLQRGRRFALRWCESSLAMREALIDIDGAERDDAGLVLLTPLATHEIADDVAARLAKGRVYQPEGWEMVRELFTANATDARLGHHAWMPQLLIDGAAQGNYEPVASGFLDLETAWREILRRFLRIDAARPDAVALLQWTQQPGAEAALNLLPTPVRADLLRWLAQASGTAGRLVLACVEAGRGADALPLGLVCDVIFSTAGEGEAALTHAAIRLERFVGGAHVGTAEGRAWADAARSLVDRDGADALHAALDRADALLQDLKVAAFARFSDVLPRGLDQRLRGFATALQPHSVAPTQPLAASIETQAGWVLQHLLVKAQPARADRVEMARRLSRWLLRPLPATTTVEEVLVWQSDEGAFVDWARFRLLGGDELPEVSQAYAELRAAVIGRRDALARSFAPTLKQANSQGLPMAARVLPVETVLDRLVAPLAALQPVLLLVVDGLSVSIFRELFARPERLGWTELVRDDIGQPFAGLAALPTVTEVSRASLLCGRLVIGSAPQEKTGFAAHPGLLAHSKPCAAPRLFHKADLAQDSNLSPEVRAALANPQQRIVGVVYNAVDDHLSGPDQLLQRWSLEDLRLLLPLLREARDARRVVVVTADHGHLLEDGTHLVTGGESDRWRVGDRSDDGKEVVLQGGRTVTTDGSKAVVCLWGEGTRYAGRKNGYHGGVSPQELTVPMSVLAPAGMALAGWQPALPAQPDWWDLAAFLPAEPIAGTAPVKRAAPRRAVPDPQPQAALFGPDEAPILVQHAPAADPIDWIAALLASPVYASQRQLAARVALPDTQMRRLLEALAERGGKLSRAALAQRLGVPEMRLGGLLSAVRRLLNVDQSAVLVVDETAGTVDLNRPLLLQQFVLGGPGGAR